MEIKISNPNKIYWPDEGYTKQDLVNYYQSVLEYIYPYLKDKAQSLHRFPDGIYGQRFYQKNVGNLPPDWVHTESFFSESNNEYTNYIVPDNKETIIYMANLGCIEMNPWNSKMKKALYPDYLVMDLDPEEIAFSEVIKTAVMVKEYLTELSVPSFCKTSGATGLHIYVPMGAKYTYDQVKLLAHLFLNEVHRRLPEITSLERMPAKRKGKVYLDYLQNNLGQTMASPYSLRPRQKAPVSTPLLWEEVKAGMNPEEFNILNLAKRLKEKGDIFRPVLGQGIDINKILKKIKH